MVEVFWDRFVFVFLYFRQDFDTSAQGACLAGHLGVSEPSFADNGHQQPDAQHCGSSKPGNAND